MESHQLAIEPTKPAEKEDGISGAPHPEWPASFVGSSGKLYVRIPRLSPHPQTGDAYHTRAAVYQSIEAYNTRAHTPDYVELSREQEDRIWPVTIELSSLTIQTSQ